MLKEGNMAPAFKVVTDTDAVATLKDFAGKPLILYFYPKDMTTGCTQEACDFRDAYGKLRKKATLLGISRDSAASHVKFRQKFDLPFPLGVDADGKMCQAYGVWKEKSMYGRKYFGIERTTVIIDAQGRVAKIFPKVRVRGHADAVLAALDDFV